MTSDRGDSSSLRPRSPLISPDVCLNCKQPMVMVCPESKDTETGHWTLEFERERECARMDSYMKKLHGCTLWSGICDNDIPSSITIYMLPRIGYIDYVGVRFKMTFYLISRCNIKYYYITLFSHTH